MLTSVGFGCTIRCTFESYRAVSPSLSSFVVILHKMYRVYKTNRMAFFGCFCSLLQNDGSVYDEKAYAWNAWHYIYPVTKTKFWGFCCCICAWFRNAQKLVDKTTDKIRNQQGSGDQYKFLSTLLSRKDLSYKDVSIITLSLFADGLNTVRQTFLLPMQFIWHPDRKTSIGVSCYNLLFWPLMSVFAFGLTQNLELSILFNVNVVSRWR